MVHSRQPVEESAMTTRFTILLTLTAFALAGSGSAFAADMAIKAPPPLPAPVFSWTGWYVGVTAGYGFGNSDQSLTADAAEPVGPPDTHPAPSGLHPSGFVGGGEVGYNNQAGSFLAGLEADFSYSGSRQTAAATGTPFIGGVLQTTVATKLDWFGTVRGRIGVLPMNNLLLYATGGFAYGDVQTTTTGVNLAATPPCNGPGGFVYCASGMTSGISVGWTAGAGLQYAIAPRWMIKAEYLYIDLGRQSVTYPDLDTLPVGTLTSTTRFTANIVRVGVDYRF
jgi:outer membrane immunogenic protein